MNNASSTVDSKICSKMEAKNSSGYSLRYRNLADTDTIKSINEQRNVHLKIGIIIFSLTVVNFTDF